MSSLGFLNHLGLAKTALLNLKTLLYSPYWSENKMASYQLKQLIARLTDAKNVPYYQSIDLPDPKSIHGLADWKKIPILTKSQLLQVSETNRLNNHYAMKDLISAKSSGSTGESLTVYYNKNCFYYHMMVELRFFSMAFCYMPWHKQTYLYTQPHLYQSFLGLFRRKYLSTLTPIDEIIKELIHHPPDVLVGYPSILRVIVDQMSESDLSHLKLKAVGVNSELSSPSERQYLTNKLQTKVFDDYSSEELIWIASQCTYNQYHIFEDINYIEIVDDNYQPVQDGIVGNIVGTNLHNQAMPFLRYLQGDKGAIKKSTCQCGRQFKVLEKLEGRRYDAFELPNGKLLSPGYLLDLTDSIIFQYSEAVCMFRLIQETPYYWVLKIVPAKNWHSNLFESIKAEFYAVIAQPEIVISIETVDHIPRVNHAKHLAVISNWTRRVMTK